MLNLFPIQFLAPLAYVLLRIALSLVLLKVGMRGLRKATMASRTLAVVEIVTGVLYFLGLFTQIAALLGMALSLMVLFPFIRKCVPTHFDVRTAFFILTISISLFITGAGPFAFDLPI